MEKDLTEDILDELVEGEGRLEKSPSKENWVPTSSEMDRVKSMFKNRSNSQVDGNAYIRRLDSIMSTTGPMAEEGKLNDPFPKPRTFLDPSCDPENPVKVHFQDISAAAYKIRGGIERTPCTKCHKMSAMYGMEVYMKKEFLQVTGSFKERGARNTLMQLSAEQRKKGVVAASAGNHALALSYHGFLLGIPVTVVMPVTAPIMKVSRCRENGANVIVEGSELGEAKEIAMALADTEGLLYVNGYDHPHILAGAGTVGLEIVDQIPDVDAVVIPVGGGGLLAGIAVAIKYLYPNVQIIGVESENCPSFFEAMKAGKPVYTKPKSTLADGLAVSLVGVNAFATAVDYVDDMILVSETDIARTILYLAEIEKAVVEGAGATGVAALVAGKLNHLKGKKVVFPLGGGNIDTTVLGRCLERGLAAEGRLVRFAVTVSDRPGGIAELTALLARLRVSIKDIFHERAWLKADIYSVRVKVVAETLDWDHVNELEKALRLAYSDVMVYGKESPSIDLT